MRDAIALRLVLATMLASCASSARGQLMTAEQVAAIRSRLPAIEAREWHDDLHSPEVVWYTEREMPRAYQHAGGFHSPSYNISADPSDSPIRHGEGGNANVQFPWVKAGGLDRSPDAVTATGLLLPARENGSRWPVVVWNGALPGHPGMGRESALRWMFPAGTVLFEVVAHPIAGELVTCEVRARLREIDSWGVGLFRPFPSAKDLRKALEERSDADQYRPAIAQLLSPKVQVIEVSDRANRSRPAFVGHAGASFLPELPASVTRELMRRPFRDALGAEWATSSTGEICYAPTTSAHGQIVPRYWMASLVGTDTDSCQKCHHTVAQHARTFDRHRGWYGHVRGDDDVFTFHPVEPSSIAYNGATVPARLRQSLVRASVVEAYDPKKHPPHVYRQINWPARRQ